MVRSLENYEGVTAVRVRVLLPPLNKFSEALAALVRFHKDMLNQHARTITLNLFLMGSLVVTAGRSAKSTEMV